MRIILGSLSFLYVVWLVFVRRRRVSLFFFFSSSGAGETQTAQRFVVPLVLSRPRSSSSTRSPSSTDTSRHTARTCCFVFFFRRLAVGGGVWSVLAVVGLSRSLSLSFSAVRLAMHVCLLPRERGGGLPDGAPSYDHNCLGFFREMSMGQCPGRSVQNCPCSPHFLRSPLKQRPEEEVGEQPYCQTNAFARLADRTVTQMIGALPH